MGFVETAQGAVLHLLPTAYCLLPIAYLFSFFTSFGTLVFAFCSARSMS